MTTGKQLHHTLKYHNHNYSHFTCVSSLLLKHASVGILHDGFCLNGFC